jgi:cysteine dioxygenase
MSRPVTLPDLVARLVELPEREISVDAVTERLADGELDLGSVEPYVTFRDDRYTRQLVHRDELFDVIVLCWRPGQTTPVHNHSGQLGWVRLVRGAIREQRWSHPDGGTLPDLTCLDIDDDGVGHGVELVPVGEDLVTTPGTVVSVDRERAIHRLGHPGADTCAESTVTLHVYSRPHDTCLAFDTDARTCRRRTLVFDNAARTVDG